MTREDRFERNVHNLLPNELSGVSIVSFDIRDKLVPVQHHLKTIFGDSADWSKNIAAYYNKGGFQEITLEDIRDWFSEEASYTQKANELLSLRDCLDSRSNVVRAAELLGISSRDGLYHFLTNGKQSLSEEQLGLLGIAERLMIDTFYPGVLMKYPVVSSVMTQPKHKYFYRGENALFGASKPGAYRMKGDNYTLHRIEDLRREEGCLLLDHFDAVVNWPHCQVNHLALAQHYGLKTSMMDITGDLKTALFFACCTYENGGWRPLRKEEFAHKDSRPVQDARYAVLYRSPQEYHELNWLNAGNQTFFNTIIPIGYQPFMRCKSQTAYGLFVNDSEYNMYQDPRFEKYVIRLSEELCSWVYEESHQGNDIYPSEDIPNLAQFYDKINQSYTFSRSIFNNLLDCHRVPEADRKLIEAELNAAGYSFSDKDISWISDDEIAKINSLYPVQRAVALTGIQPVIRPIFIITGE